MVSYFGSYPVRKDRQRYWSNRCVARWNFWTDRIRHAENGKPIFFNLRLKHRGTCYNYHIKQNFLTDARLRDKIHAALRQFFHGSNTAGLDETLQRKRRFEVDTWVFSYKLQSEENILAEYLQKLCPVHPNGEERFHHLAGSCKNDIPYLNTSKCKRNSLLFLNLTELRAKLHFLAFRSWRMASSKYKFLPNG